MDKWLLRNRRSIYVLLQILVVTLSVVASSSNDISLGPVLYVEVLFALCTAPLLLLEHINGRYVLLAVFMATYFLMFGALDLQSIFTGADPRMSQDGFLTAARVGVLIGAALVLTGYLAAVRWVGSARTASRSDWSTSAVLFVGLACWVFGSASMAYYSLFAVTQNTVQATAEGLAAMGPLLTFAVMLGQLVQPVGLVTLAYGYARNRGPLWLGLIVAVVTLQVILGFLTDTKGTALFGFLLVALTKTVWDGKVSKAWIGSIVLFALLLFPVFQAYRVVVRDERALNRYQALERFGEVLALSFESSEKINSARPGERPATFIERSNSEGNIERVFDQVGLEIPFLNGRTLVALPLAFVPRLILPDKEDVQVGQLYTRTFFHTGANDFTYISVSELGEFYWNFGWPGVVVGMLLTGLIMGVVGAKCDLSESPTLTRLLVLLVTMKTLCFMFGGSISLAYIVWLRGIAAIGLLHLMFARPAGFRPMFPAASPSGPPAPVFPRPRPTFPNLLR